MGLEEYPAFWNSLPARIMDLKVRTFSLFAAHQSITNWASNSQKYPRPAKAFRIKYDIRKYSYSLIEIDQLKMTGETYKPFKGIRANSKGDVDWRW